MAEILGNQRLQSEVLEGLSMCKNHRQWFASFATPHLGDHPIEIGAGLGEYAEEWLQTAPRMTVAEADPDRLVALKAHFGNNPAVDVRQVLLPSPETADYTAAVAYNVIEHIEDDVAALRSMGRLLRPGGAVIIVVPAFMFAMSPVDVAVGHVRRYTKRGMRDAMIAAGLEIQSVRYANTLGLLGYYLSTSILKMTPKPGPVVYFYDRFVLPLTRFAEWLMRRRPPFGQSVVAIARTPLTPAADGADGTS